MGHREPDPIQLVPPCTSPTFDQATSAMGLVIRAPIPNVLARLKTHTSPYVGKQRQADFLARKHFESAIMRLWQIISEAVNDNFEITVNETKTANALGLHRNTIARHLNFFEKCKLIRTLSHGGGCGRVVEVLWLVRAAIWAREAKAVETPSRGQNEPVAQQRLIGPLKGLKNGAHHTRMGEVRTIFKQIIHNRKVINIVVDAFGAWKKLDCPPQREIETALGSLRELMNSGRRLPVPRWAKSPPDIYRWMRALLRKLAKEGDAYLDRRRERWLNDLDGIRLRKTLAGIRRSIHFGRPCPICGDMHDQDDWKEGRNADGELICVGWARIKQEDNRDKRRQKIVRPDGAVQYKRPLRDDEVKDPAEAWRRYHEEKAMWKAPLSKYFD